MSQQQALGQREVVAPSEPYAGLEQRRVQHIRRRQDPARLVLGFVLGYPSGQVGSIVVRDPFRSGRVEQADAARAVAQRGH
jgi:hypothetical protein